MSSETGEGALALDQGLVIETGQVSLRPIDPDDARLLAPLFKDDWDAVKQTGRMPFPVTVTAFRGWLNLHRRPHNHGFLVQRAGDLAPMGVAGFGGDRGHAEIGYAFGRRYWGAGHATAAVRALTSHAARLGFHLLEAHIFIENPASARVVEKAGFLEVGIKLRRYPERGGLRRVRHFQVDLKAMAKR